MSDETGEIDDSDKPRVTQLDSDAILVGAYCAKIDLDELRRYVAMDLVVAFNPLTKESLALSAQVEAYLAGKGLRVAK